MIYIFPSFDQITRDHTNFELGILLTFSKFSDAVLAYGNPVEKMEREDPVENGHYEYKEDQQEVVKDEEQVNDPRGGSRGSRRSGWDKVGMDIP